LKFLAELSPDQKIGKGGSGRENHIEPFFLKQSFRGLHCLAFPSDIVVGDEKEIAEERKILAHQFGWKGNRSLFFEKAVGIQRSCTDYFNACAVEFVQQ